MKKLDIGKHNAENIQIEPICSKDPKLVSEGQTVALTFLCPKNTKSIKIFAKGPRLELLYAKIEFETNP